MGKLVLSLNLSVKDIEAAVFHTYLGDRESAVAQAMFEAGSNYGEQCKGSWAPQAPMSHWP